MATPTAQGVVLGGACRGIGSASPRPVVGVATVNVDEGTEAGFKVTGGWEGAHLTSEVDVVKGDVSLDTVAGDTLKDDLMTNDIDDSNHNQNCSI